MNKQIIDFKHSSHKLIIEKLREKRLNHYVKLYKQLVYLINANSQKNIFNKFEKRELTSLQIENIFIPYFEKYKIDYLAKEKIKYPDRTNAERNKKYRDKQNEKKRVRLSFYVDEDFFKKLQRIKNYKDSNEFNSCNTYEDIFKMLLNTHFRSKFNIGGRF